MSQSLSFKFGDIFRFEFAGDESVGEKGISEKHKKSHETRAHSRNKFL
jgi:hypothetical protein